MLFLARPSLFTLGGTYFFDTLRSSNIWYLARKVSKNPMDFSASLFRMGTCHNKSWYKVRLVFGIPKVTSVLIVVGGGQKKEYIRWWVKFLTSRDDDRKPSKNLVVDFPDVSTVDEEVPVVLSTLGSPINQTFNVGRVDLSLSRKKSTNIIAAHIVTANARTLNEFIIII